MIDQGKIDNWHPEHFISYLYAAAAAADADSSDEEISMALRKSKKLFDMYFKADHLNHEHVLTEVLAEIVNHSEKEKTDIINDLGHKFKLDPDLKMDLVSDLTDIITSDDMVNTSEHHLLNFVRGVFSNN